MAGGKNIFGRRNVPSTIQTEIAARNKNLYKWNATRFPWVLMTSMSGACSGYQNMSSSPNLDSKGGKGYANQSVALPHPVITQVQVKKQGELGTTRKCTVSLTAYNDEQLIELQKCFFIPSMSVRVQWGWSINGDLSTTASPMTGTAITSRKANKQMRGTTASDACYDGLQGKVANFKYNLNNNNYWDCEVEIISEAEMIAGASVVNTACSNCASKHIKQDENGDKVETAKVDSIMYTFLRSMFEDPAKTMGVVGAGLQAIAGLDNKLTYWTQREMLCPGRDINGNEDLSFWESITPSWLNAPDTKEPFISWSTFEAAVNAFCLPRNNSDQFAFGRLTSTQAPLAYNANCQSSDPRVCYVPGGFKWADIQATGKFNIAGGFDPTTAIGTHGGRQCIILDYIMLNVNMIANELKGVEDGGDKSLRTFVLNVLNRVNDACGNLWEFDVISTSDNPDDDDAYPTVTVVDTKVYDPSSAAFALPSLPKNSMLRELKLEMKMTEAMKSQALYSGGNGQVPSSVTSQGGSCGPNAFSAFRMNGTIKDTSIDESIKTQDCSACDSLTPTGGKVTLPTIDEIITNLFEEINNTNVDSFRTYIRQQYANNVNSGNDDHCKGVILPFEFSFTLDGIGGFGFGQMVTSDRIPQALRDVYEWQVTSVEHSITVNDWTTTVNTVCRYKAK